MAERVLLIGLGAALAMGLSGAGTAWAAPSAALFAMRHHRHQAWYVAWAPMVISGVLSLYGLIIGVLMAIHTLQISDDPQDDNYIPKDTGYRLFAAGFVVGVPCLVSGAGMAAFLRRFDAETVPVAFSSPLPTCSAMVPPMCEEQPLLSVPNGSADTACQQVIPAWAFIMNLAFMEAIGLYGLILALFLVG